MHVWLFNFERVKGSITRKGTIYFLLLLDRELIDLSKDLLTFKKGKI
jgi:hypothetical protein